MSLPTEAPTATSTNAISSDTPHPNGMSDEQVREALAALGRRKNNPGYLKRLQEGAKEARQRINAEYLREMDAEDKK